MCNNNKIPASDCLRGLLFKNEPKKARSLLIHLCPRVLECYRAVEYKVVGG